MLSITYCCNDRIKAKKVVDKHFQVLHQYQMILDHLFEWIVYQSLHGSNHLQYKLLYVTLNRFYVLNCDVFSGTVGT